MFGWLINFFKSIYNNLIDPLISTESYNKNMRGYMVFLGISSIFYIVINSIIFNRLVSATDETLVKDDEMLKNMVYTLFSVSIFFSVMSIISYIRLYMKSDMVISKFNIVVLCIGLFIPFLFTASGSLLFQQIQKEGDSKLRSNEFIKNTINTNFGLCIGNVVISAFIIRILYESYSFSNMCKYYSFDISEKITYK